MNKTTDKCEDYTSDRISSKFLDKSTHFLIGEIEQENINECVKWIIYENLNKQSKLLTLYINSQGGDLYEMFGLIDVMRSSHIPIRTIAYGSIMSAAFVIFVNGTKGHRYIAPNTGIMCHQFSSTEDVGKYHDIKATRKETDRCNKAMMDLLKSATGLDGRVVKNKLLPAHDVYLTPQEMIDLGAADKIMNSL